MALSEDDDDFEDAVDDVNRADPKATSVKPDLPREPPRVRQPELRNFSPPPSTSHVFFATPQIPHTPKRPSELEISDFPGRPVPAPRTAIPTTPLNFPSTPVSAAAHARDGGATPRERLLTLRHRMNKEFGAREAVIGPILGDADETMSVLSEAVSLHSWHRNFISGPDTLLVHASDSASTCAMSIPPRAPSTCAPDLLSSPEISIDEKTRSSTWSGECDPNTSRGSISPRSPPPSQAPPPVPSRHRVDSDPVKPVTRVPPPLPPRNPSFRLPDPVSLELASRLNNIDEEKENTDNRVNSPVEPPCAVIVAQRLSSKSNDSVKTACDTQNGVKKKGHTKSNSLDRGLTLAKTIKAGPFPPPANKSNSLTRQEAGVEEEERNCAAEGIIRQITTGFNTSSAIDDMNVLEPIASAGSSSISSPSSSTNSSKIQPGSSVQPSTSSSSRPIGDLASPVLSPIERGTVNESFNVVTHSPLKSLKSVDRASRSVSHDDVHRHVKGSLSTSFDPIALDVERRLSMKRDGNVPDDRTSLSLSDDGASRMSVARSSIDHAKSLARNSVMYASGFFRGALKKVRNVTHTGSTSARSELGEDSGSEAEASEGSVAPPAGSIVRPRKTKKGPYDFEQLTIEQEIDAEHTGAVWCIKFSICGRLLATAGQDNILRIWVVRSHYKYFSDMREKYHMTIDPSASLDNIDAYRPPSSLDSLVNSESTGENSEDPSNLFMSKPFSVLKGHTSDILDLSWSKNYFILSSGMDRTVKLWHLSRSECLCCFQHIDFVTCVAFLPKDDRYFLSGSLDGKLRLWHIPDKKVAVWNEVQVKFITAITFVKNGKFAVVGTYDGRCYFYTTDQLKYHTVVDVRSSRGKNAKGHKVTGLAVHGDKLLVTSNDSRIRMYDTRDKALTCKFRGVQNEHSQIRAAFSPDGRHVICGSEDKFIYLWRATDIPSTMSVRKDRNSMWERVRAHTAPVTVAVFAPRPQIFLSMLDRHDKGGFNDGLDMEKLAAGGTIGSNTSATATGGHVIVSADLQGSIKVMVNRPRQTKTGHSTFFNPNP